jgi:hypothetical protein
LGVARRLSPLVGRERKRFFFKKRTKKRLPALREACFWHLTNAAQPIKSFLVLFYKKEPLPSFS